MPSTLVILDAERVQAETLAATLAPQGFHAECFSDPLDALRRVLAHPPDAIIATRENPRMSGLALAAEVSRALPGESPPIFLIDDEGDSRFIQRAYAAGITEVIVRPIREGLLIAQLRRALGQLVRRAGHGAPQGLPRRIGQFLVESELGRGGMGVVYRARSPEGRTVALKTFWPSAAGREDLLRFQREVEILRSLRHPNLVRVYDSGRKGEMFFFAMQLLEGEPLDERLDRKGRISEEQAIPMLATLASALEELHGLGIVHRDIKPGNILVCEGRGPVLTDFGLSRRQTDMQLTRTDRVVGTAAYMSPEMILGHAVDHRADLFSLGLVAIEMLADEAAVPGRTPYDMMAAITAGDLLFGKDLQRRGWITRPLAELIDSMLAADPEQRPRDAATLRQSLEALIPA